MAIITVQRQLIGTEDLTLGLGTVTQQRRGQSVQMTQINASHIPFSNTESITQAVINERENSVARDEQLQSNIDASQVAVVNRMDLQDSIYDQASIDRDTALAYDLTVETSERQVEDTNLDLRITSVQNALNSEVFILLANTDFTDIVFPWDLGGIVIAGNLFSNEKLPATRVSLSQSNTTTDLGLVV